jgi:hypothetical protein
MEIQIGPIVYEVLYIPELCGPNGSLCGDISSSKARIRINADDDPQVQVVTLWHEVIHGILFSAGITEHDEVHVDAMAYGLVQVLRDNPEIIPSITAAVAQEEEHQEAGNGV